MNEYQSHRKKKEEDMLKIKEPMLFLTSTQSKLERVPRKKRQPLNWFGMPMTRLTCCLTHVQDVPYV